MYLCVFGGLGWYTKTHPGPLLRNSVGLFTSMQVSFAREYYSTKIRHERKKKIQGLTIRDLIVRVQVAARGHIARFVMCVCVSICVCMYVCVFVCVCVYMCVHICMCLCVCVYMCVYVCMCLCVCVCVSGCVLVYILDRSLLY